MANINTTGTVVSDTSTITVLISATQVIVAELNAALQTAYQTTGSFITGQLVCDHYDKYHHKDMHPNDSITTISLQNADTSTLAIVAELTTAIQSCHDNNVDVTGYLTYGHQDPNNRQNNRPSIELTGITVNFIDKNHMIVANATTKLPHNVAEHPDHIREVSQGRQRYIDMYNAGAFSLPRGHTLDLNTLTNN